MYKYNNTIAGTLSLLITRSGTKLERTSLSTGGSEVPAYSNYYPCTTTNSALHGLQLSCQEKNDPKQTQRMHICAVSSESCLVVLVTPLCFFAYTV